MIKVDGLFVPLEQFRTYGHVDIPNKFDMDDADYERIVGIVHTHPGEHRNSRVRFSTVDTGEGGLNWRWPMSLVIGLSSYNATPKDELEKKDILTAYAFGWDYQCLGKRILPCGGKGIINYLVAPLDDNDEELDPEWPYDKQVFEPEYTGVYTTLGDCKRYERHDGSTKYLMQRKGVGHCELIEEKKTLQHAALGIEGNLIREELDKIITHVTNYNRDGVESTHTYNGIYKGKYYENGTAEDKARAEMIEQDKKNEYAMERWKGKEKGQ